MARREAERRVLHHEIFNRGDDMYKIKCEQLINDLHQTDYENSELREDVEEMWELIMYMRDQCAGVMARHAPSVFWTRPLACERDRAMTPMMMLLAYSPAYRDCTFPDAEEMHPTDPLVVWDGSSFRCRPDMLIVYTPDPIVLSVDLE